MRRSYRRSSSSGGLGGLLLLLMVVMILVVGGLFYFKVMGSPVGRFDRFNIVVASSPVRMISLSKKDNSAVVVVFPDDLYISEVAHGYGQYRMARIYEVGELDRRGGEVLSTTVEDYMGVPIDGYLAGKNFTPDLRVFFLKEVLSGREKSDLDFIDRLQLFWLASKIRFDRVKTVDLSRVSGQLVLPDGSNALSLEKDELDNIVGGLFTEDQLRGEGYRVEVLNSTPVAGLGNRAARILGNIGMAVVNVGTMETTVSNCQIQTGKKFKDSLTVERIKAIFACQVVVKDEPGLADVTVIVGQSYADWLEK